MTLHTVAGGHQAGWSIGTEHALCQTSIRALQPVVLPVMPYGCSRALAPQTCARRSRPARSCGSHTKVRRIEGKEEAQMSQTKHDLPAQTRAEVIEILNARLADSIDLMPQATQAHGHVKGPSFLALHKLFDEVVDAAEDAMDLLAERVVQLGGTAEGDDPGGDY